MNNDKIEMFDALDGSNKLVVDQVIQKLYAMQVHSQREFGKIKYVRQLKYPELVVVSNITKMISDYKNPESLKVYYEKMIGLS